MVIHLKSLKIVSENVYLHIQGHHLYDNVVSRILNQLCSALQSNQYRIINDLSDANNRRKIYESYKNVHHFSKILANNLSETTAYWQIAHIVSTICSI